MSLRAFSFITSLHFHVVLPLVLLAAAAFRYNALSFMYLVCLLISPLLRTPTKTSMKGLTGIFLKCLVPLSLLPILGHIIFHITLVAVATDKDPYGSMFTNCSSTEKLVRQIGYQRLDKADVLNIIRLVVPDAIVFTISVITLVLSVKLSNRQAEIGTSSSETPLLGGVKKKTGHQFLKLLSECLQNVILLVAGVIVPSVLGGVYFIVFLIVLTMWGCYKSTGRQFGYVRILLLIYTGSHILLLHLYQFQFFQDVLPPSDLIARIVGLTGIVKTECGHVDRINFYPGIRWSVFVNPGILLILYWFFALNTLLWRSKMESLKEPAKKSSKRRTEPSERQTGSMVFSGSFMGDDEPGEDERLVEHEEPPGGHYGGVNESAGSVGSDLEVTGEPSRLAHSASDHAAPLKRRPWMSVLVLIMRQSYVLSLIAMMAWSITYHSWLTFTFLLAACILWMLPNSRQWCLRTSPVLLVYAELLLLGQYIFGMNLDNELPKMAGNYKLDEIGLKRFTDPCLNLALQAFFTLFIVLTMRQYLGERSISASDSTDIKMQSRTRKISILGRLLPADVNFEVPVDMQHQTYDSKTMLFIGHFLWSLLCKYWILFCTIMMAIISLQDVVIYRIIYMILFFIFIIIFQVNFTLWRAINCFFWWVVVLYSMLVLSLIYTYQFEEFHNYWTSFTGFDDAVLKDIGLERYDTAGLFVKLLTPTSFLVFVILQLRYFHQPFLELSAMDRYKNIPEGSNATRSEDERNLQNITEDEDEALSSDQDEQNKQRGSSMRNWLKKKILYVTDLWKKFTIFLWRLGEIHFFKLVTLIIIIVSVNEVSALTAIYVLLVAILLPLPKAGLLLSHVTLVWTTVIILAKMIFQLSLVETHYWITSCEDKNISTSGSNETDNAIWFGLQKIWSPSVNSNISYYVRFYVLVLAVIVFESIIRYHQRQYFRNPVIHKPDRGILFANITRVDADKGIVSCIKFFANYLFYKFGLECCYIMTAVTVCVRVDAVALIYIVLVAVIMMMSRRSVAHLWPIYKLVLAILLAVQFVVVLGFPPGVCIPYPWANNNNLTPNLKQWLYLPDYIKPPHSLVLIADFLQLLFVSLQAFVFSIEGNHDRMESYGGGDNSDILADVEQNKAIPCKDFTLEQTRGIDMLKHLIFEHMFWLTMAIVFITGATRINIFSLFYVIAVFCFMWFGKEFFLKPLRSMLRMWNYLVGYCILVMFFKTALQLVGCVYVETLVKEHQCWLVQLFGVNCLLSNAEKVSSSKCEVEKDDAGLAWDVVCLTFLLLQRRIYSSHYFRHVVDTIRAQNNLVSKGAELINRIMIREVNKQNEQERSILANIKKQMKILREKQAIVMKDYKEPEEHFQAIRAGDYYLFEHEDVDDKTTVTSLTFGTDHDDKTTSPTPLQVVNTAYDQDIETAIETYPSPSADADGQKEGKEESEEQEPESVSKIWMVLNFFITLWYSFIDWLIQLCNQLSRNYRLVAKKLSKELVAEKAKIVRTKETSRNGERASEQDIRLDIEDSAGPSEVLTHDPALSQSLISLNELEKQDEEEINQQFKEGNQRTKRLFTAVVLLLVSRSELLCYFLMILDQMVYGSLLSLPLPLMVFLWGMLSVPRPSKTFWVTIITYTEAVVVCKYLFQFGFFPWNDGTIYEGPFFPPRIIGIEKKNDYANVDIALLLALFLHRSILMRYGLWRDAADITADMEAAESKEQSVPNSPEVIPPDEDSYFKEPDSEQTPATDPAVPRSKLSQGLSYIVRPFTKFFKQVTQSSYNASADVYAQMFFCDFILFLVLVFGFSSFGPADTTGDENVTSYLQDNKIPVPFLIMLITQFIFIIIDRALFLRKFVLGKFIFQILLVILIHIWMFFILPAITKKSFFENKPAQIWYLIKCIYFGLSAYQIRCGYPNRILGNFLTKKYGYTNLFLFKGFLAIPFLLELRALMDWIWTDSTMAIGNWLQMEDIYANIFVLKCYREIEKTYPQERAIKKGAIVKYLVGGILLVVIIFIIWFPLVFFSFFNSVFISNPPYEASITIGITGYQPLFTVTAQGNNIVPLTDAEFGMLRKHYSKDRNANSFLNGYDKEDVTMVAFDGRSLSIWGISPVSQQALASDLVNNTSSKLSLTVEMKFTREPDKALPAEVTNTFELDLRNLGKENKNVPSTLAKIVSRASKDPCKVYNVFPRFVRLASQSKALALDQLITGSYGIGKSNISLLLESDSTNGLSEWWNVNETVMGSSIFDYDYNKNETNPKIYVITFNDRKAPASLSFLSGYGIIGLYISFILLIGRLMRLSTTNQYLTIMFRELPDVDGFLQLCLDIYLVREMKEFRMEEDLYAKLIFLYRSPETTIKFTRQTVRIGNIKKKSEDKKKDD
ncbi:hypothetical protein BsWGS_16220 [Bradybaena similaris]